MASVTVTFDTKTLRDAYVAGAEAVRSGVINACRERLATLDAASPEAAAWREVEAACLALELPPQKRSPRPTHEADFRPLPSVAEVLAHNARTGGALFGWWLCDDDPDNPAGELRAVQLDVGLAFGGDHDEVYGVGDGVTESTRNLAARWRPITRRGEALPWPEAKR